MKIISTIVKIKREQDSLVPSNCIQVNAWCTNWVIYVLVIFYDLVNSAWWVGRWRGVYTVLFLVVRKVFVLFYVKKKIIINKNVTSINVKNFTNDLYYIINSEIFPVWLPFATMMLNIRHSLYLMFCHHFNHHRKSVITSLHRYKLIRTHPWKSGDWDET